MKQVLGATLASALMVSATAQSAESNSNADEWQFALGAGISTERSPYKGVGTDTDFLPLLAVEKGPFYFFGTELGYNVVESDEFGLTLLANYRGEGYDASDSRDLRGMADRDGAFELGARGEMYTDFGDLSLTVLADVSDKHDGYEVELGWGTEYMVSPRLLLEPSVAYSYRSDDLNNYYYGVRASEVTAQRAAYNADAGGIWDLSVGATYMLDEQQSIRGELGVALYGDEISDSSIVERDNSPYATLAYIYRF